MRYVLGTPTLQDVFHANRWDYPYYNKPGYGDSQERRFTVWFENDLLARWEGDDQPNYQPFQTPEAAAVQQAEQTTSTASPEAPAAAPDAPEASPLRLDTPSILQGTSPNQPDSQPLR